MRHLYKLTAFYNYIIIKMMRTKQGDDINQWSIKLSN
jgi:hypothetical protein